MTNKTSRSQQRRTFWRAHLEAWSDSGLRQSDYCRIHGLAPQQFSHWKHKLLSPARRDSNCTSNKARGFVQVHQAHGGHEGSGLSIALPNGLMIRGIDQNNLTIAAQLIQAL